MSAKKVGRQENKTGMALLMFPHATLEDRTQKKIIIKTFWFILQS